QAQAALVFLTFALRAGTCGRVNGDRPVGLHGINPEPLMSALGQKQTSMRDVRFTPKSGRRDSAAQCPLCAKSRHDVFAPVYGGTKTAGKTAYTSIAMAAIAMT